ncbi:MAG: SUMF1/EgtB/PvdO family nonheme iron enzyme [Kiritimatiellae bacterium]|nr:SUMF1/EgtB/PvdO family nonheme iron enzyme [Kiritimatiellia bacterium]
MSRNGVIAAVAGLIVLASSAHAEMKFFAYKGQIRNIAYVGRGAKAGEGTVAEATSMGEKKYGPFWNIEFSGVMELKSDGQYAFTVSADDGCGLFIDGKQVNGKVNLKAGLHQVNLLYYNWIGDHWFKALVTPPGGEACNIATLCTPSDKRQDLSDLIAVAEKEAAEQAKKDAAEAQRALIGLSSPEALTRSIKHILKTKPREYKNGRDFLKKAEGFVREMPQILERLEKGEPEAVTAMDEFAKLKQAALVTENPYFDFDETLVVLSDKIARKNNWLGTHVINTAGYRNKIARLNLKTGQVTDVYEPQGGTFVGELDLHYDGQKLLFSGIDDAKMFQVMEVGIDGSNPRQVSTIKGDYVHNYGGVYLPNEKIVFSSTAPLIGVPCISGSRTVPNLYLMGADGGGTRQLTFEQDADWYPTVLADGKIMYLRWEYTDIMHYYSRIMMTMNPDGTNQRAIYGSQSLWPNSMFYARPLPGAPGQFSAVVSGHHGVAGTGKLTIFDTNKGFAHADGVVQHIPGYGKKVTHVTVDQLYPEVKKELLVQFPDLQEVVTKLIAQHMPESSQKGKDYHELNNDFFNKCYHRLRDFYPEMALDLDELVNGVYPQFYQPYPVSAEYYLVVAQLTPKSDWDLYLVDVFDNFVQINPSVPGYRYALDPYPLKKRERPPIIPERVNLQSKEAVCYIQNVYRGPGLKGVPVGTVHSLRLFTYAYGYFQVGNHHHIGIESGWDIKRMLGTVEVEKDGSAMFSIPANTTISIQPLDKEGRALQLFRSWLVAMPGEELSCIGCHEPPTEPPVTSKTLASGKAPQRIKPYRDRVEGFAFDMEIQPVLDAYCARCHDGSDVKKPDFKTTEIVNAKSMDANYSVSYYAFHKYFRRPGPESNGLMATPYEYHASTSEGVQLLQKGHHGVKLDDESWRRLYTWIDLNVPYYGSWSTAYATDAGREKWTTEISAKAAAMRSKYALVEEDWEYTPTTPYAVNRSQEKGPEKSAPLALSAQSWPFSPEVAKQMQSAAGGEQKRVFDLGNGVSVTMVRIPAGEFIMGSDAETTLEQPRNVVKIEKAFWISESEVNNAAYFTFKPDHDASVFDQQWKDHVRNGYYANYEEQPAVRLSWIDAQEFCRWFGKKNGVKAALPTEAQWEWACRAGSPQPMFFGSINSDFSPYANLADKSLEKLAVSGVNPTFRANLVGNPIFDFVPRITEFDDKQFLITGTKQYQPNAWGLYDMHGNVAEWTRSDYVAYPYQAARSNSMDPKVKKTVRGGSFFDRPYRATASYRWGYAPWQGVFDVGFRVVIEE